MIKWYTDCQGTKLSSFHKRIIKICAKELSAKAKNKL